MTDSRKGNGLKPDPTARTVHALMPLGLFLLTIVLGGLLCLVPLSSLVELGLIQPMAAALMALAIVTGVRLTKGRFIDGRRKGTMSASSATIAVKLWAVCFALFMAAILASAYLIHLKSERLAIPPGSALEIHVNDGARFAPDGRDGKR